MTMELFDRPFAPNDIDPLLRLFGSYFSPGDKLLRAEYAEWLYMGNPAGRANVVVALDGEKWVGFLAMIPVMLAKAEVRQLAYYVVNVLVHPDYQGKHLFSRMINVAKDRAAVQGGMLMGHPNRAALTMWKRARMQFHEPLKPHLIVPRLPTAALRSSVLTNSYQAQEQVSAIERSRDCLSGWRVVLTGDYLQWRYFDHPTHVYRVQLLELDGEPLGIQITRRIKAFAHLWVDQFMRPDAERLYRDLPLMTVAFRPFSVTDDCSNGVWRLPLKKDIPFFSTKPDGRTEPSEWSNLGLSASDF
jgi:GNAT superfamily N-acetyltransferase